MEQLPANAYENSVKAWSVAGAAFVGFALSYATIGVLAFGLLIAPLTSEFGWQRGEISLALSLYTLAFMLFSVPIGSLMDRVGTRPVIMTSITLFGLGLIGVSFFSGGPTLFYLAYFLLGVFSAGTIPSGYTRVILNWFDAKRGLALAVSLSGVGFGMILTPPVIAWLLEFSDWRAVYQAFGLSLIFICLPVVYFLLTEFPKGGEKSKTAAPDPINVPGLTLAEALRNRAFHTMGIAFFLLGVGTIAINTHIVPLMLSRGVETADAAYAFSLLGAAVIFGRLTCGYFLDRYFASYVAVFFLGCPAVGLLIVLFASSLEYYMLGIVLIGIGGGAEFDFMSYLTSRYLGMKNYGQIYGAFFALFYVGAGIGVWALGYGFDVMGSYDKGLVALAIAFAVSIVLLMTLGPYVTWGKKADQSAIPPQST